MSATTTTSSNRNLMKTVPGLLISAFFLWYTFKGISFDHIRALRLAHPSPRRHRPDSHLRRALVASIGDGMPSIILSAWRGSLLLTRVACGSAWM